MMPFTCCEKPNVVCGAMFVDENCVDSSSDVNDLETRDCLHRVREKNGPLNKML